MLSPDMSRLLVDVGGVAMVPAELSPFPQHVFVQGSNEFPDAILLVRWPPQEPVVLGMPGDDGLRFWIRTVVHMTVYDLQT